MKKSTYSEGTMFLGQLYLRMKHIFKEPEQAIPILFSELVIRTTYHFYFGGWWECSELLDSRE